MAVCCLCFADCMVVWCCGSAVRVPSCLVLVASTVDYYFSVVHDGLEQQQYHTDSNERVGSVVPKGQVSSMM
jgi:hypothetical protein